MKWPFSCVYDTDSYNNGKSNVASFLLTPTVVTRDNIKAELVDTGYYYMDEKYPRAR